MPPAAQNPDDEQQAQRMIADIRTLVLPQQKDRAREMIKAFPNTRLAQLAQKLLDEHKLYEAMAAAENEQKRLHTEYVREYWKARYPEGLAPMPAPMRLTNSSSESLLYQVRGPGMEWSSPHTLRIGEAHVFRYPVTLRRITKEGVVEQDLNVGVQYRFVAPAAGGSPTLVW
ncbi:MAG: hypothetical protein WD648_03755 [Planctomycetaceae bacterium]